MGFWPFARKPQAPSGIYARSVVMEDGVAVIDVRGQTCPGYLLAIHKAMETLPAGTTAKLLISYPPCGDDVAAWCAARATALLGTEAREGRWEIMIRKQADA